MGSVADGIPGRHILSVHEPRAVDAFSVPSCTDDLSVAVVDAEFFAYLTLSSPTGRDGAITAIIKASGFRPDAYVRQIG